jgi:hypothetical protein
MACGSYVYIERYIKDSTSVGLFKKGESVYLDVVGR